MIDWSLSPKPINPLEALQHYGLAQQRSLDLAQQRQKLQDQQRLDAARPVIQQRLTARDYGGAQAEAISSGAFDMAQAIGGFSDDQRKELAAQNDLVGRAAYWLKSMPLDQRQGAFVGLRPTFERAGIDDDHILGMDDFSDGNLDQIVGLSQSIKDQIAGRLTQSRIDDIGYDNERADTLAGNTLRNTDDVIADRAARRSLTARGQNMADARGRYATDTASGDRRRGQDLIDRRTRDLAAKRPGKERQAAIVSVRTREEALALPPGTQFRTPDGAVKVRP